jgi:hypothetical protein
MEELMKQNKELQEEIIQLRTTMNSRLEKVEAMSGTLTLK